MSARLLFCEIRGRHCLYNTRVEQAVAICHIDKDDKPYIQFFKNRSGFQYISDLDDLNSLIQFLIKAKELFDSENDYSDCPTPTVSVEELQKEE